MHGDLDKFQPFKNSRKLLEKRQLRRVVRRQFRATGQLYTVFWTRFRLFTKDAKFKQTASWAESLNLHFKQHDSCARCFGQVFAS